MTRVVLADDSATARELLRAILQHDGDIRVVGEATDGGAAVSLVTRERPDLVVMDVHMPVMDGLQATKEIMMRAPTPIIIVSAVTQRDVDLSLSATQAGALLALPKPEAPGSPRFQRAADELRSMVRAMAQVKVVRHWSPGTPRGDIARPREPIRRPSLVAIAASTGGPAALRRLLIDIPRGFPAPILIVQHIARDFTAGFVEWLAGSCALPIALAADGEPLAPGRVFVAPDDTHLGVTADGRAQLSKAPPIGGFRPSANYLFESAARAVGPRLLAIVLTGMGSDGAEGLVAARRAGAYVIAQDEASSVVYGMAGEAVGRGAVDTVASLDGIARYLVELTEGVTHVR